MSIKDILVHLDHTSASRTRMDIAIGYASLLNSHLHGIHITPSLSYAYHQPAMDPRIVQSIQEKRSQQSTRARQLFEGHTALEKNKSDFVELPGEIHHALISSAAWSDVVVVGRSNEGRADITIPERVVLGCGRPVVVVPDELPSPRPGNNVLIAWNGKKESVRAVHDSLPWLMAAEQVKLVSVNAHEDAYHSGHQIAIHLRRHGVNVEVAHVQTSSTGVAERLLTEAHDFDCHLLVMGAYGYSRLPEILLGGTTRTILTSLDLPVFLSH